VSSAVGGGFVYVSESLGDGITTDITFTAQTATTYIVLLGYDGVLGHYAEFDDISLTAVQAGKLIVIPDFTIDLSAGQTVLRCWG
jgi:hypothetical protein